MTELQDAVSIESGLEGRNNGLKTANGIAYVTQVSIESGLEGRNNWTTVSTHWSDLGTVSIESGLEGRNNRVLTTSSGYFVFMSQ